MPEKNVSASEFARHFGRYRDEAAAGEIVNVTIRGRDVGEVGIRAVWRLFETAATCRSCYPGVDSLSSFCFYQLSVREFPRRGFH